MKYNDYTEQDTLDTLILPFLSNSYGFPKPDSLDYQAQHTLARLLILDDSIMRYVLLNDQTAFPADFSNWSLRFAIETFNTPTQTAA